jgi:hypothetical protein
MQIQAIKNVVVYGQYNNAGQFQLAKDIFVPFDIDEIICKGIAFRFTAGTSTMFYLTSTFSNNDPIAMWTIGDETSNITESFIPMDIRIAPNKPQIYGSQTFYLKECDGTLPDSTTDQLVTIFLQFVKYRVQ